MDPNSPLTTFRLDLEATIAQTSPWLTMPVTLRSPAPLVMTDLAKVKAATIAPQQSLRQAEQAMLYLGVRMLFVVAEMPRLEGVVTSTDLQGEKPMQLVDQLRIPHDALRVADLMTPLESLDAVDYDQLARASVGNLIATLKRHGRNHLLVIRGEAGGPRQVRGVVSRAQIERQLGQPVTISDIAESFAEIERALA